MQLPNNLSEEDFLEAFNNVILKIAHKYVFVSYDADDIQQEAFIIAVNSLRNYDSSKSLENFLYVHLNNRLKNFKRDNYYRYEVGVAQKIQDTKKRILEPIDIGDLLHVAIGDSVHDEVHAGEIMSIIDSRLPADMRGDYLKIKNKGKITKSRRNKVIKKIREIIDEDYNYKEEDVEKG